MIDKFNRSEAYKLFRQIFNQLYGNTPALGVITYTDEGLVLSLIGTDETISLKNLPVGGAQGDIVYCNADGDWVSLGHGDTHAPLTTGGASANPSWGDEVYLKPKANSSGAEGTLFFASGDKKVYVGVDE